MALFSTSRRKVGWARKKTGRAPADRRACTELGLRKIVPVDPDTGLIAPGLPAYCSSIQSGANSRRRTPASHALLRIEAILVAVTGRRDPRLYHGCTTARMVRGFVGI